MRFDVMLAACAATLLAACATDSVQAPAGASPPASAAVVDAPAESQRLHALVDEYFEQQLELNPLLATSIGDPRYNDRFEVSIAPEWRARAERVERDALARLATLDRSRLTGQDLLSYDVFKSARELEIEGYRFPDHLLPLNQFYSTPNSFAMMGSGKGIHPFRTVKDYEDFLKRLDGFVAWTDQAIANMREGVTKGYTLPRVLTERILPQLEAHVVAAPEDSIYYGPVRDIPTGFAAVDRERLTADYRAAITGKVIPSYRKLLGYMRDEYLPKCRTTVGLDALPDGAAWYAYNVRTITTTDYTPAQIHAIGLAEVERIHGEMREVMRKVGFKGDLKAFSEYMQKDPRFFFGDREKLIAGYVDIKRRVAPALPKLFERIPTADYEVRAVEAFREKSAAGGSYQAASEDGSRPGVFYANTYDLKARPMWAMEALSLHEANPGHHFQISLQREQKDLPKFRRFSSYTAYSEGWGLYAESLGRELGLYEDPYQ
ncbi:MAG TPA: DUF885 family protein, partial [Steroidobacteraceae bacterium]|nr:DUF885 family protein [Steroidobacteraceae bacterium]